MSVWWTQVKCQERCRVNFFIEKSGIYSRTHLDNIHNSSPIYMVNHSFFFFFFFLRNQTQKPGKFIQQKPN